MRVGVGADHGGFDMKNELAKLLAGEGYEIVDFGNKIYDTNDDYPDLAIPLARAMARGDVDPGILLYGSGVGAGVAANKIIGARAALCHDDYSARQGLEDDNVNILCLGGRTTGVAVAWDCTRSFLNAKFSGADRHRRRLARVLEVEQSRTGAVAPIPLPVCYDAQELAQRSDGDG